MNDSSLSLFAVYFTRDETLSLLLIALLGGAVLLPLAGPSRRVVRNTLIFALLCLLGNLLAIILAAGGAPRPAAVLHGVMLIGLGIGVIRLAGLVVFRLLLPHLAIHPPRILEDIVVIVGYLLWGLFHLRGAGLDLSSIVTTSAVITAVVAFAMQDTLGNILGGLALQLDSSIQIGDWVIIDQVSGQVVDIRWRYTAVRTRNGETVVFPNSLLMKGKVKVVGDRHGGIPGWRRIVPFDVDFIAPPSRVVAVVEQALREAEIPCLMPQPLPTCVLMEFGAGYGHYHLRYWLTDPAQDDPTDSLVRTHIFAALKREGWPLGLPQSRQHLVRDNAQQRRDVESRELAQRQAALRQVTLFDDLSEDENQQVAEHLVFAPFAAGEVLTREGAIAHCLFLITSGEAKVVWQSPKGEHVLARLGPGDCFGEMGLLTGEPRTASVIAETGMTCYRLDKPVLEQLLHHRPGIAEALSQLLARRIQANEAALQAYLRDHAQTSRSGLSSALLEKIRDFFQLD